MTMNSTLFTVSTIACFVCFPCVTRAQSNAAANEAALKKIVEMRSYLATSNLSEFVRKAGESGWKLPAIRSSWYVDRVPEDQTRRHALEQARRDFGFLIAGKLTKVAETVRLPATDRGTLRTSALTLLELRDQLLIEPGYGNLFLARRAVDIAAVAATRLVADLSYSDNDAEALVFRFTDDWNAPRLRRRVLNDEAGREVFQRSILIGEDEALKTTWGDNIGEALRVHRSDELRKKNPGLDFFVDDEMSEIPVATTETLWNHKMHFLLVQGLDTGSVKGLRSLLIFRQKVGRFPLHGGTKRFKEDSEVAGAFEKAWRPYQYEHQDEQWRLLHSEASAVYEKVTSGALCDEDELQARNSSPK